MLRGGLQVRAPFFRMPDLRSRWEAQAVLTCHGVRPGTTMEDFRSDLETLADLRASTAWVQDQGIHEQFKRE